MINDNEIAAYQMRTRNKDKLILFSPREELKLSMRRYRNSPKYWHCHDLTNKVGPYQGPFGQNRVMNKRDITLSNALYAKHCHVLFSLREKWNKLYNNYKFAVGL